MLDELGKTHWVSLEITLYKTAMLASSHIDDLGDF
jgi:hypothetical protein